MADLRIAFLLCCLVGGIGGSRQHGTKRSLEPCMLDATACRRQKTRKTMPSLRTLHTCHSRWPCTWTALIKDGPWRMVGPDTLLRSWTRCGGCIPVTDAAPILSSCRCQTVLALCSYWPSHRPCRYRIRFTGKWLLSAIAISCRAQVVPGLWRCGPRLRALAVRATDHLAGPGSKWQYERLPSAQQHACNSGIASWRHAASCYAQVVPGLRRCGPRLSADTLSISHNSLRRGQTWCRYHATPVRRSRARSLARCELAALCHVQDERGLRRCRPRLTCVLYSENTVHDRGLRWCGFQEPTDQAGFASTLPSVSCVPCLVHRSGARAAATQPFQLSGSSVVRAILLQWLHYCSRVSRFFSWFRFLLLPGVAFSCPVPCNDPCPLTKSFSLCLTSCHAMGKSQATRRRQGQRLGRRERQEQQEAEWDHEQGQQGTNTWLADQWDQRAWDEWQYNAHAGHDWSQGSNERMRSAGQWDQHAGDERHYHDGMNADWTHRATDHDTGVHTAAPLQSLSSSSASILPDTAAPRSLLLTSLPRDDEDSPLEGDVPAESGGDGSAFGSGSAGSASEASLHATTSNPPADSGAGAVSVNAECAPSSGSSSSELRLGRARRPPTPPLPNRRTRRRKAASASSTSSELVPDLQPLPADQDPCESRLDYLNRCLRQALIASTHPSAAWAREKWGSQTQKKVGPQRSFAPYPQRSAVEHAGALYFASCSQPRHVLLAGSVDKGREGRIPTDISLASHETPLGTDPGFGVEKGGLAGPSFRQGRTTRVAPLDSAFYRLHSRADRYRRIASSACLAVCCVGIVVFLQRWWLWVRKQVIRYTVRPIPKQYIRCRIVLRLNPLRTWYIVVRQSCHRGILQSFASCLRTSGSHLSPLRTPPSSPKFRAGQGPNSLGSALRLPLLCILLLSLLGAGNAAATAKPRVVEPAASTVPASAGKAGIEAGPRVKFSFAAKRAYRRARNRAHLHGQTYYRGTLHTADTLNTLHGERLPHRRRPQSSHHGNRRRLNLLTYNCGGFTSAAWAEFTHWLDTQSYDVVVVQETHWQSEGCFTMPRWYCITAAAPSDDKYSGVLVMVASKLACSEHIRYTVLHPGRLLHVKIGGLAVTHSSIDVLGVYQYVWRSTATKAENLANRAAIWSQLDKVTTRLPARNTRLVMGDLNTRLCLASALNHVTCHIQARRMLMLQSFAPFLMLRVS